MTQKKWMAIQYQYDELMALSDDKRALYCLSEREIAVLLTTTKYSGFKTRWYSDTGVTIDTDLIQSIQHNLERTLTKPMSCGDFDNQLTVTNQYMQNFVRGQLWDGTNNTSVNTLSPTGNFNYSGTVSQNDALCTAITEYINQSMLMARNTLANALGIASVTAGALGWLGGAIGAVVGGVVVLGAGLAYGLVNDAVIDRTAIDSVSCMMYNAMRGVPANRTNFQNVIGALSGTSNEEDTVINVLNLAKGNLSNYLWFVDLIGFASSSSQAGLSQCGCTQTWEWSWAVNSCTYDLPVGWSLTVNSGSCGDGVGGFDGFNVYTGAAAATVQLTIDTNGDTVESIRVRGTRNFGGGIPIGGSLRVQCDTFDQTTAPITGGYTDYTYSINQTGDLIITITQNNSSFNGVCINQLEIDYS